MDATVLQLVQQISNGQADTTEAQNFYNDIVGDYSSYPILTNFTNVTPDANNFVNLPASSRKLFYLAYNGSTVGELSPREADWIFPDWQDTLGAPEAYIGETFNAKTLKLVPGDHAFPATAIYAESRQTLPTYLQLPTALFILYNEYMRASDHQNFDIAKACKSLGDFLMQILMKQEYP